jgi:MraZ protein
MKRGRSETAPMALFAGTYENRIDRKGRVSLPADFRAELPVEGNRIVYVYPSPRGGALEACDRAFMQRMADSLEQFDMFSDEENDLASIIVAEARRVSIDGEGRVLLPPELIEFAGIDERVTFVGRGARFQIWDPTAFSESAAQARERAKGRTMRLLPVEGRE